MIEENEKKDPTPEATPAATPAANEPAAGRDQGNFVAWRRRCATSPG